MAENETLLIFICEPGNDEVLLTTCIGFFDKERQSVGYASL